jgi:hypothetical protein
MIAIDAWRPPRSASTEQCDDGGNVRIAHNSCRGRRCPKCEDQSLRSGSPIGRPSCCSGHLFPPRVRHGSAEQGCRPRHLFKVAADMVRADAADAEHLGA